PVGADIADVLAPLPSVELVFLRWDLLNSGVTAAALRGGHRKFVPLVSFGGTVAAQTARKGQATIAGGDRRDSDVDGVPGCSIRDDRGLSVPPDITHCILVHRWIPRRSTVELKWVENMWRTRSFRAG